MRPELTSDDLARAVFAAAKEAGEDVPDNQAKWVVNEVSSLVGDENIVGFSAATVGGSAGYVFSIIGDAAYLLRWDSTDLEITFLSQLAGLTYRERGHAVGGDARFQGDPWLRIEVEHEQLPGLLALEASDWQLPMLEPMRLALGSWLNKR